MKITINNIPFEVFSYDDNVSILKKYAIAVPNALPQYFRIVNKDFDLSKIEEKYNLEISDIRNELAKMNIDKLSDGSSIAILLVNYPYINRRDIAILWIMGHPNEVYTEKHYNILKKLARMNFSIAMNMKNAKNEYPQMVQKQRDRLQSEITAWSSKVKKIYEYKSAPVEEFKLEEIVSSYTVRLPNGDSILDIFDSFDVSREIPFLMLIYKDKTFIKVYKHITPPDKWITHIPPEEGIYIKILSTSFSKVTNKTSNIDSFYSDAVWTLQNQIEIQFDVSSDTTEKIMQERIFSAIGNRIVYDVVQQKQISIKGIFQIRDFELNRVILADMVTNDELLSYFFFFVEKTNTVLNKKRFYLYFEHGHQGDVANALTITITPQIDILKNRYIDVRISKAKNIQQVNAFRDIFSHMLGYYSWKEKSIIDLYASIIPGFKNIAELYIKKEKAEKVKKTGKRADALRAERPEMFIARYPDRCQQTRQPYLISGKEAALERLDEIMEDEKIVDLVEKTKSSKEHLMINFPLNSEDYYFCAPREENDTSQDQIWPGLMKNKTLANKEKFSHLPCCFLDDQYLKKKGGWKDYLNEGGGKVEQKIPEGYILGANKQAIQDRTAQVPYFVERLLEMSDIKMIKKGKDMVYPIARLGVVPSPDSFIHCMERIFNADYLHRNVADRKYSVSKVRKEIANWSNFSIGKQELYDFTYSETKQYLLEEDSYIDPTMFISLIQKYYKCNIILFKIDKDNPNGAFQLPRYSQAYLMKAIDERNPTILISMFHPETPQLFPYQCEIVHDMTKTTSRFNFSGSNFLSKCIKAVYASNDVYVIQPKMTKMFPPMEDSDLFFGVTKQYIDDNGKARAFQYEDGVYLMTSPLPPLDVPAEKNICEKTEYKTAYNFIQQRGFKLLMQDGNKKDGIQGVWVQHPLLDYGYIPLKDTTPSIKDVDFVPPTLLDPLRVNQVSEMDEMKKRKKIATFLMQYSLYTYSLNPKNFGSESFYVDEKHKYDIESLNKRLNTTNNVMWRGKKLIVPSKDAAERLKQYVKKIVVNNEPLVRSYSERKMIEEYYTSVSDFRQSCSQFIFTNRAGVIRWKQETMRTQYANTISSNLLYGLHEPYFYRNDNLPGVLKNRISIVQNVKDGDINRAVMVSDRWITDRVNIGYDPVIDPKASEISYILYKEDGSFSKNKRKSDKEVSLIEHSNGAVAALLFFVYFKE